MFDNKLNESAEIYEETSNEHFYEEYKMLREEIMHHKKRQNDYSTFACTAVITIIGTAVVAKIPELCLLSLLIVLPCALKSFESRYSISLLSTYMKSHLEPKVQINWETNLSDYREKTSRLPKEKLVYVLSKFDFVLFSLVSCLVYWILQYINILPQNADVINKYDIFVKLFDLSGHLVFFLQFIFIDLLCRLTTGFYDYAKLKVSKLRNWEKTFNIDKN